MLDAHRTLGVPATRASHVRFYLNGEYRGLYLLVEEADGKFLREHFGSDEGNLYQCRYVGGDERADLVYRLAEDYEFLGPPEERGCRPATITCGCARVGTRRTRG